ncbi:MAG: RNA 2',3'-cyclic phosphodiesterase [Candidatus Heimdallarchaeota archaeon]|nr:RNA 2',3'-cyclic phosphodiesterase [Candidatus Heimdallarchaeota archaeon]
MIRSFIAVKIPSFEIENLYSSFAQFKGKIKFVDPHLFHITQHFFGDINVDEVGAIMDALNNIPFEPFLLDVSGAFYLPKKGKIRTLVLGIGSGNNELIQLTTSIRTKVKNLGYKVDSRPITPHLTIGRIKSGYDNNFLITALSKYSKTKFTQTEIEQIHLIKSTLTHSGPEYDILASFPH